MDQFSGGRSRTYEIAWGPTGKGAAMKGQTLDHAYIPLPAGAVGLYSGGAFHYRHADWLGSSRVTSKSTAGIQGDVAYAPFGEPYNSLGTADQSFTGQPQDIDWGQTSGLYDFTFREYHAASGRWISPDPAGLAATDPNNPQSWNRYSYVRNNPLAAFDPLGLDCVYLNDSGTGVQSVDHNSNPGECWGEQGFWANGWVGGNDWVVTDPYSNNILIGSSQGGFLGVTLAGQGWSKGPYALNIFPDFSSNNVQYALQQAGQGGGDSGGLSDRQRAMLVAIGNSLPTFCGGGGFLYGGGDVLKLGPVHVGAYGVLNADSRAGVSLSGLGGVSAGPFGYGFERGYNFKSKKWENEHLALGEEFGIDSGLAEVGVIGGGVVGGHVGAFGVGVGAYGNLTTAGSCQE